VSVFVY